jgi:heme/copper-type cytochrome/quinol oxidase subunit 2
MDLVPYLSTVILIATIATIVFAVLSYAVFKLRDRRRPTDAADGPVFFREFLLERPAESVPDEGEKTQA